MEQFDFNKKTFKIAAALSLSDGAVYAAEDGSLMALVPLKYTGSRTSPIVTVCYERFSVRDLVCTAWHGAPPNSQSRTVLIEKEPLVFTAANLRWGGTVPHRHRPLPRDPALRAAILECADTGADAKMIAEALDQPRWIVEGILGENIA